MTRSVFNHRRLAAQCALVADSFNRANGALGQTDGQGELDPLTWDLDLSGLHTITVSGNEVVGSNVNAISYATLPIGVADIHQQITTRLNGTSGVSGVGLVSHYVNPASFGYYLRAIGIQYQLSTKRQGTIDVSHAAPLAGDVLQSSHEGVIHRYWVNGYLLSVSVGAGGIAETTHGITVGRVGRGNDFSCWNADCDIPTDSPEIYASDTYERTVSPLVGDSTDGPGSLGPLPYTVQRGTWDVNGNSARNLTRVGGMGMVGIETGLSDCELYWVNSSISGGYTGAAFRIVDSSNFLVAINTGSGGQKLVQKVVGGVRTTLGASATGGSSGLTRVVLNGDSIKVYNHGGSSPIINITDSTFQTATQHGHFNDNITPFAVSQSFVVAALRGV